MKRPLVSTTIWLTALLLVSAAQVRADLSRKQARKVITRMAGWSLPDSAVHIDKINSTGATAAEATAEMELVFRFSQQKEGYWRIDEVRIGADRWERLEVLAEAARLNVPDDRC